MTERVREEIRFWVGVVVAMGMVVGAYFLGVWMAVEFM